VQPGVLLASGTGGQQQNATFRHEAHQDSRVWIDATPILTTFRLYHQNESPIRLVYQGAVGSLNLGPVL
jgi:hypothetical protein